MPDKTQTVIPINFEKNAKIGMACELKRQKGTCSKTKWKKLKKRKKKRQGELGFVLVSGGNHRRKNPKKVGGWGS